MTTQAPAPPRAVLITGATTPMGLALTRRLLADPRVERVLAVGLEPTHEWPVADARVHYAQLDLTRSRTLRTLLFGLGHELEIEAVVHAAHHRRAHDDGQRVRRLNVELTRELVYLCERHPSVRRFVYRSFAAVYRVGAALPDILREDSPIEMSRTSPQWLRDRVEADLCVATLASSEDLDVVVLRCAECLAPELGSQLWDYLDDWMCLRPLGFDPMLNLLSLEDLVEALWLALVSEHGGIFNIPGADTLPLSAVIAARGRPSLAVPGPLLSPLYALRASVRARDFRYDLNRFRFHFSGILDGTRAARVLGYEPRHPLDWLSTPTPSAAK